MMRLLLTAGRNKATRSHAPTAGAPRLLIGLHPDPSLVHQADLALDHLLAVLRVLHGRPIEVQIFRIDWLLVEQLIELGPQILQPVVPLRPRAVIAQSFDVDHPGDVRRAGAILLPTDDLAFVVDDERSSTEGVDR